MHENRPLVSVVIPTFNGLAKLKNLLAALENQTFTAFETIVVIDGGQDDSEKWLQARQKEFSFPFRFFTQRNAGQATARNAGAKRANADFLIFFDDDMRPPPDLLARFWERLNQFSDGIVVGAQIGDPAVMTTPIQRYKLYLEKIWLKDLPSVCARLVSPRPFITAASFGSRRSLFHSLGGFDERLRDYEDADLAMRADQTRVPIYFDPALITYHDDKITCRSYILRLRAYRLAAEHFRALKPELAALYPHTRPVRAVGWRRAVYSFFARRFFVELIDRFNLFLLTPRFLRYRVYDLVIHGLSAHFPQRPV